ncbi:MAG: glycosyltransferase family 39 protein [Fimbriimonadaceae bacterium]
MRVTRTQALPFLLAAVAAIAFGLPTLTYPFGTDQGIFALGGWLVREGGVPYRDFFDVKPPGVFFAYALSDALFGQAQWGIRLLDVLVAWLTASALVLIVPREHSLVRAWVGPLSAAAYFLVFGYWSLGQAEGFVNALVAWALVFIVRSEGRWAHVVLAGALIGLAAVFKTPALAFLAVLPFAAPARQPLLATCRTFGLAVVGVVLVAVVVIAWFWGHGAWDALVENYGYQRTYASSVAGTFHPRILRQVVWFVEERPLAGVLTLLLGCGLLLGARDRARERGLLLAWSVASLLVLFVQVRLYVYHYVVLLPSFALGAAWFVGTARSRLVVGVAFVALALSSAPGAVRLLSATMVAAGQIDRNGFWSSMKAPVPYDPVLAESLAAFVRAKSRPGETVYIHDYNPAVYVFADRRPPFRVFSPHVVFGHPELPLETRRGLWNEVCREARLSPPSVLLLRASPMGQPALLQHLPDSARFGDRLFIRVPGGWGAYALYRRSSATVSPLGPQLVLDEEYFEKATRL